MGATITEKNWIDNVNTATNSGGLATTSLNNSNVSSTVAVPFRDHRRVRAVCSVAANAGSVTFSVLQSTNAALAGVKAIGAGKTVVIGATEDETSDVIDVNVDEMDIAGGFTFVSTYAVETATAAATGCKANLEWGDGRYEVAARV